MTHRDEQRRLLLEKEAIVYPDSAQPACTCVAEGFLRYLGGESDEFEPRRWPCAVYRMRGEGIEKIGISSSPLKRRYQVQLAEPGFVELVDLVWFECRFDALAVERSLQEALRDRCVRGEWFSGEVDNFRELAAGTALGACGNGKDFSLEVRDEWGRDVSRHYFHVDDGELKLRVPVMPSMLSRDETVIRQDCLCYLMERYSEHVPKRG